MKTKKPVLVAALVLALLAVALIVPAVASAKQDKDPNPNQPVNWVVGNYSEYNAPPDSHLGFTVNVRQSGPDLTLEGFVLQKLMYTENPLFESWPVVRRATDFSPESDLVAGIWLFTGLPPQFLEDYAMFYEGTGEYEGANVAEFVIYLPVYFPGAFFTTMPHLYEIYDFGEPGRDDLVRISGWSLSDPTDLSSPWTWVPSAVSDSDGGLIPVPAGNFQVHIGQATD